MKPSVYVETTIPSYLVGRISPVIATAGHQMATRMWWEERRNAYRLYVSSAVDQEIQRGDPVLSRQRQDIIADVPRLPITDEVIGLAEVLYAHLNLPDSARMDAFHLAVGSHYQTDYLLTWNLRHIAGGRVRLVLARLERSEGIYIPVICTPEEILELEDKL
ncbi:MAG: type II toxin-antitoxin system VapC family toxin [Pirellulaceae bacterium]|nr:type II toxin-antitoxin system VapC family toxin [Pirellulaceae bacterium]